MNNLGKKRFVRFYDGTPRINFNISLAYFIDD